MGAEDCENKQRISETNCRNVWFNEFWSQAFNCTFDEENVGVKMCTGEEKLTKYRQEGLVPFVGKFRLHCCYYFTVCDRRTHVHCTSKRYIPNRVKHYLLFSPVICRCVVCT